MSKRKHQTALKDFRAKGYVPEAMINFIALLGWSEGEGDKEIYSLQELIAAFTLEKIHKAGAVFNEEKLRWFNRHYLLQKGEEEFATDVLHIMKTELEERGVRWDNAIAAAIVPLTLERISVLEDVRILLRDGEFDYFFSEPALDASKIPDRKSTKGDTRAHLEFVEKAIDAAETFDANSIKGALWDYATEKGRGAVLWPLRYALSGRDNSPDPFVIASIIGKEETMRRVRAAIQLL